MAKTRETVSSAPLFNRRLRYKVWSSLRPDFPVSVDNAKYTVPAVSWAASRFPAHWPSTWRKVLMKEVFARKPGVFIDVGANVGQTLLDYLSSGSDVGYIGFEPNAECINLLNQIIDRNDLNHCSIVPAGLSDKSDVMKFFVMAGSEGDSGGTLISTLRPARSVNTMYVPCYPFDDLRAGLEIDQISLIKIDVEGAELYTLLGMEQSLKSLRPWIAIEFLHRDQHADIDEYEARTQRIEELIARVGYQLYALDKPADESALDGIRRIAAIPRKVWQKSNSHECDYLLIPTEDQTMLETLPF